MHSLDYQNCVNGGTCPHLAALGKIGINYTPALTSLPSDSFPGLSNIITGGTPRSHGVFYDVAYDRVLAPPTTTTPYGVASGPCTAGKANGSTTEFDEGIDFDLTKLNGGAPGAGLTEGGVASINPAYLDLIGSPAGIHLSAFPCFQGNAYLTTRPKSLSRLQPPARDRRPAKRLMRDVLGQPAQREGPPGGNSMAPL